MTRPGVPNARPGCVLRRVRQVSFPPRLGSSVSKTSNAIGLIATVGALVLGCIFFFATQQPTSRDWVVLAIGLTVGAIITGWISAAIFYRHPRSKTKDSTPSSRPPPSPLRAVDPSKTRRGGLTARSNIDGSRTISWTSNQKAVGKLEGRTDGRWDVLMGESSNRRREPFVVSKSLGVADTVEQAMEMIEVEASQQ